ncbi:hypothetical protein SAMN05443575_2835 [Jatrophihabitans endophyticus]|uniref:Amidohydrolase 3 domain-containing protein n=1 Tax=Jatrophihabitans endophyticus TaxID=1206085 RepID=A0A1M5MUN9_9ACTN|nr:amidohydrolase family protein [Jatrophihabitans endophyticus]SHG81054.1 hypothetical protein SAMN05443575_2835 [Jatrophihabitans endophyticus]
MPTLYRNGSVLTPTPAAATALLVDGGRIAWIGTAAAAPDLPDRDVVDLAGGLVAPAFVDAHVHTTDTGLAITGLDLRTARSLREALDLVERAARASRGRPVLGGGWDETTWPEQRPPTSAELDRASYGGLVYLARVDIHSAVASSSLRAAVPGLAGLAGDRGDGWVGEPDAHDAVRRAALAAVTRGQRRDAQRAALRHAAGLGVASVHEMAGPTISGEADLADLLALAAVEPLPEVVGYWGELHGIDTARELGATGAGGDLFCDGSFGSATAALGEPYADRAGDDRGWLRFDTEDVAAHIAACVAAGLQSGFHAIGDAAVDQVLAAAELVTARLGHPLCPGHRLEHAEYVRDPARLAASGLTASVQPCFDALWGGRSGMYAERLGPDRALALNRFADLAAAGVPLAFGSDSPVTGIGPWAAVRAAVGHHDPAAAIPLEAAFAAHTRGGWLAAGRRDEGTLAVGAAATFAVWDVSGRPRHASGLPDVAATPADDPGPRCVTTVLRGRTLHAADDATPRA